MRRVSMREANQNFSSCIADVEAGEHLIVERRGVPIAEIIPFRAATENRKREKRLEELRRRLMKGIPLGGVAPSKDEMHGRD